MRNIIKAALAILTFTVFTSSCGLYKKYERPSVAFVDSLYRRLDMSAGDTISTASVSWDKIFTDPILQEWISLGIEHNTDINVARQKIEEAQAYLMAARRALLPGVGFSVSGGLPGSFSSSFNVNSSRY